MVAVTCSVPCGLSEGHIRRSYQKVMYYIQHGGGLDARKFTVVAVSMMAANLDPLFKSCADLISPTSASVMLGRQSTLPKQACLTQPNPSASVRDVRPCSTGSRNSADTSLDLSRTIYTAPPQHQRAPE